MPAPRRRRLWPGTVSDHIGSACGSARNHLGDSLVPPTESAQNALKSTEYVFSWHYAFANLPGPNQSFQRFAPDAQVASVEDQSDSSPPSPYTPAWERIVRRDPTPSDSWSSSRCARILVAGHYLVLRSFRPPDTTSSREVGIVFRVPNVSSHSHSSGGASY